MNNKSKGLTLVEVIITLAIGMIVLGVIFEISTTQFKMYQKSVAYDKAQVNGANCISSFRESISKAEKVVVLTQTPSLQLPDCMDILEITPYPLDSSGETKKYRYAISKSNLYKYYIDSAGNPIDSAGNTMNRLDNLNSIADDVDKIQFDPSSGIATGNTSLQINVYLKNVTQPFATKIFVIDRGE